MLKKGKELIGKSGEVAGALVNKLSGILPAVARGAAEAEEITLRGMIESEDIARRAGFRILRHQGNIESIARLAAESMPPDSAQKARDLDTDWADDVAEKCKTVSDKEMQSLWAKILVGETTKPGSFSKSTVDAVSKMSKEDALLFTDFCQFVWFNDEEGNIPLLYNFFDEIYSDSHRFFERVQQFAHLRLVSYDSGLGYFSTFPTPSAVWVYHTDSVYLNIPLGSLSPLGSLIQVKKFKSKHLMHVGHIMFTEAGEQLYRICGAQKNDAFFQYVFGKWKEAGYNPSLTPHA